MRFVLIAALLVTTTVWAQNAPSPAPAPTPAPAAKPAMPPRAVQIEQAVHALAAAPTNTSLWPGFDPLKIPLAVFDGKDTGCSAILRRPNVSSRCPASKAPS